MIFYCLITIFVIIDQVTKHLISANMDVNQTIPVLDNIFHISYVRNFGAAFSILTGKQGFLIGITLISLIGILIYLILKRNKLHWSMSLSLSLIVGGGCGNLIDRMRLGYVVDFFDFRVFPVFNMADIFVCCGCGLLILYLFYLEPKLKREMVK